MKGLSLAIFTNDDDNGDDDEGTDDDNDYDDDKDEDYVSFQGARLCHLHCGGDHPASRQTPA